ncbi:hypothetical protein PCASD_10752 [Puccinia coronata f. sp. avenae]|uniref:Uncharacterized protein n=1 Tax=Puccinia coronata f. sp. avenae TaxID=200324 RepID=A0A2N5UTB6_9BASI|nr:hypothetical protein PCASD_10752 [Puccinia coronata f. sp. avenae]
MRGSKRAEHPTGLDDFQGYPTGVYAALWGAKPAQGMDPMNDSADDLPGTAPVLQNLLTKQLGCIFQPAVSLHLISIH